MEWSIQMLLRGENNSKQLDEIQATAKYHFGVLTLQVPIVTNVNFLLTMSIQCQDIRLWELIKWSQGGECLDLLSNSLKLFWKEICSDQFGEFVCGYQGLKG